MNRSTRGSERGSSSAAKHHKFGPSPDKGKAPAAAGNGQSRSEETDRA